MSAAVFDSNILIDALKGIEPAERELTRYDRRFVSRISWIEVLAGFQPDDHATAIDFLSYFTIVELDEGIALRTAHIRHQRKRLKLADAVTLATAQALGHTLVTRDAKDLLRGLSGVRIPYRLN